MDIFTVNRHTFQVRFALGDDSAIHYGYFLQRQGNLTQVSLPLVELEYVGSPKGLCEKHPPATPIKSGDVDIFQ